MIRETLIFFAIGVPCILPAIPSIGISLCLVHLIIRLRQQRKNTRTSQAPRIAPTGLTPALA